MEPRLLVIVVGSVGVLSFWLGMEVNRLIRHHHRQKEQDTLDDDTLGLFIREMSLLEAYIERGPVLYGDTNDYYVEAVKHRAESVAKELLSQSPPLRMSTMKRLKRLGYTVTIQGSFVGADPIEFTIFNSIASIRGVLKLHGN